MANDPLLGKFEQLVLLAVVRLDGDGYGMTLRREIEERTGRSVSVGALYRTLDRLETKGLVEVREETPEEGDPRRGRPRRFFRIRPGGARALRATRRVVDRLWEGVDLEPHLS